MQKNFEELGVKANAYYLNYPEIANNIESLLKQHSPDILVITGHDRLLIKENPMSLESYQNSKYYYNTIKKAREFDRDKNSLIIYCGACMSFFEALMQAGANFASSPKRVNIGIFDPIIIAEKVSKTPFLTKVNWAETTGSTDGIGGMESVGKSRLTVPKINDIPIRNYPDISPQSALYKSNPWFLHH
ncbi:MULTISPECIES: sporulation peptidase YabG [Bacillus cereus group]|uniref:sporulation peptidase YabG n=1 Tax=Bacillus cereus group TaxID=86661 RepID=UPI00178C28CA|nr:sporulation peptidase YabG [Bacillus cereus]